MFFLVVFAIHPLDYLQTPMGHLQTPVSCMPKIECRPLILKSGIGILSCVAALALALGLSWGIKIYTRSTALRWVAGSLADACFAVLHELPLPRKRPAATMGVASHRDLRAHAYPIAPVRSVCVAELAVSFGATVIRSLLSVYAVAVSLSVPIMSAFDPSKYLEMLKGVTVSFTSKIVSLVESKLASHLVISSGSMALSLAILSLVLGCFRGRNSYTHQKSSIPMVRRQGTHGRRAITGIRGAGACYSYSYKLRLLLVLLFGSATAPLATWSRLQSAPPAMPPGWEWLHQPSWRVEGASPPPVRAPPPSGKLPDLRKALVVAEPMHVARRLATINVSPSDDLQSKLNSAGAGDTLVLADGTYSGSGDNVLEISKDITIRAQNSGQAILDGENARRVIYITSGTVTLEGLNITRGYTSVRCPCPAALRACLDAH